MAKRIKTQTQTLLMTCPTCKHVQPPGTPHKHIDDCLIASYAVNGYLKEQTFRQGIIKSDILGKNL